MGELVLKVRFRSTKHTLPPLASSSPLSALFNAVETATGCPVASQKLILAGKLLPSDSLTTVGDHATDKAVILCSGATREELGEMKGAQEAASKDRVRGLDSEVRVQRRRMGLEEAPEQKVKAYASKESKTATLSTISKGAFGFGEIKELQADGLAAAALAWANQLTDSSASKADEAAEKASREAPSRAQARAFLQRVADDEGVKGIMKEREWRVGILTEMPPFGKVGVSGTCLLGFNKGRGMEISLRIRTDNLLGFRDYATIIRTVIHELAHMQCDDHDNAFKELNSQLTRDYARLNWREGSAARAIGGAGYGGAGESG